MLGPGKIRHFFTPGNEREDHGTITVKTRVLGCGKKSRNLRLYREYSLKKQARKNF